MASFHPYPRLPYELRQAIIEECLGELGKTKSYLRNSGILFFDGGIREFRKRCPRLAKYATIDRQWKSAVEKRTFRSLSLRVGDFNDPNVFGNLERICVEDRIEAVSKIHLSIPLDNPDNRLTESSTAVTNVTTGPGSRSDADAESDASIVHAERVATEAFGRFFRVLKSWSREREPLSFTCELLCQGPRKRRLPIGTHLRIDSSSFPEVSCIGSFEILDNEKWGIQPASSFRMLRRLPNATHATLTFDDDLESPDLIESIQGELPSTFQSRENLILTQLAEAHSTCSFQGSKLKSLSLESSASWLRKSKPEIHTHPSLQLSQAIFSMTSKLEEMYLYYVVDVPAFLRQACTISGNTTQDSPAWPNLRILSVKGYSSSSPSDDSTFADELYDSVTAALPHMPNMTRFQIAITSPFYVEERCYWDNAIIYMELPPRDDRSAMDDGQLILCGTKPDEETVDTWQQIARRQWHCKLAQPLASEPDLQSQSSSPTFSSQEATIV